MFTTAPTVAIVGGGALGAALVGVLVERLLARGWPGGAARPRIVVFEKSGPIGRGLAYARDASPYLLNTSAQTMSVLPGRPAHFFEWLARRGLAPHDEADHVCPRQLFGDYVEDCFGSSIERARRRGITVSTIKDEVLTFTPLAQGGYRLITHGHAPVDAAVTVLALGNLPDNQFRSLHGPGFIASPYPGDALRTRVPAGARVAILGTGLSAIDTAIALRAAGHQGPTTMASRGGLLPTVRGPLRPHDLRFVTEANVLRATDEGRRPLRWATVLGWIEQELAAHGGSVDWDRDFPARVDPRSHLAAELAAAECGPRLWQSVGEALNPMVEVLWHHLADDDRRLFLDHHRSRFMAHWVPIPLVTARRLLGLLRERSLEVEGALGKVARDPQHGTFVLSLGDRRREVDVVVNATGTPRHLTEMESPLLQSLLHQGTVQAHEAGGVRVAFDTLRVLGHDGRPDPSLFAIGHLTCGTHLFTSTLDQNVLRAERLAAQLTAGLGGPGRSHVDAALHSS
jgi:uncharacterized NAD(P)/FAD-binding protein YdhS